MSTDPTLRRTILTAASLVSEDCDNGEYDRALVELVGNLVGVDLSDESTRDAILLTLRALS